MSIAARILTIYYFAHFLIILPLLGWVEKTKPLPNSISEAILKKDCRSARPVLRRRPGARADRWHARPRPRSGRLALGRGHRAPALAADEHAPQPPRVKWSFAGPFGKFDRAQLQRGFKVYREVCQVCHGLKLLSFRNLADPAARLFRGAGQGDRRRIQGPGRPERSGRHVRARRPAGRPLPAAVAERERRPRALQRRAARHVGARQGAQLRARLPVVHLRHVHPVSRSTASTTFIALLNGYKEKPPPGFTLPQGSFYNEYFPGHAIAMPPPLDRQAASTTPTARRRRSISTPRTSPRS